MIRNHIKFAVRLFIRDRYYSLLNLLGLSMGISCSILVMLYLQNDLTYDRHHQNHDRVYRLTQHLEATGASINVARISELLPPLLMDDLPELEAYVRFNPFNPLIVKHTREDGTEIKFTEERIFETDSNVFSMFTHQFIAGNPKESLRGLHKVVITQSTAEKYFEKQSALGKTLELPDGDYEVTGVVEDIKDNSHLKFDMLISGMEHVANTNGADDVRFSEAFWNPNAFVYLMFTPEFKPSQFYDKFPVIFDKYYKAFAQVIDGKCTPSLEPLADVHFYSDKHRDLPQGNISYVYTFAFIGLFIMLLACINYVNLATARAVMRTGEMGVRKALGYSRRKLFFSLLIEAFLSAVVAMVVSLVLCYFVLYITPFNDLIGKQLTLDFLSNPLLAPGVLGITIIIGLLSGVYPAIYIPSVPVVKALKSSLATQKSSTFLRKVLITFQFLISMLVIICTTLMGDQIDYMRDQDLGFNQDNILLLGIVDTTMASSIPVFQEVLTSHHNIESTTFAYGRPGMGVDGQVYRVESKEGMVQQAFNTIYAGHDYLKTIGLELVDGRGYDERRESDYLYSFIVNEKAVELMNWGTEAVGKNMKYFHDEHPGSVVGVVKDFNYQSLHNEIEPLVIILDNEIGGWLHVKLKNEGLTETMSYIQQEWAKLYPDYDYAYEFLDQGFDAQYKADQKQHQLISLLSYLCIILSILGLLGLSAFIAGQKSKEIGVRKVLGASVRHILLLFSMDYLKLIAIGFLIAVPLSNYIMQEWRSSIAYKLSFSVWQFATPGILVMMVALLAVSWQSFKSARANPVDALRSE